MLDVKTPEEALRLIQESFTPIAGRGTAPLSAALGRVLAEDVTADEFVPDFDRSTVDGYALRARDSFGCSDSLPAVLTLAGEVQMGRAAELRLEKGCCAYVPTGGAIPEGADCAVMLEYVEDYGDGTVGILKSAAPGTNLIFRGDDVSPGKTVLRAGRVLAPRDIGALAALGVTEVPVRPRLRVGLISTGDELVEAAEKPGPGQMRDVNTPMLSALFELHGAECRSFGIVRDEEALLRGAIGAALEDCDAVVISGGSSAGVRDAACKVIESFGELLLHGIAVKPGKPCILGRAGNRPLFGLPGHPAAALCAAKLFVLPLLDRLEGRVAELRPVRAFLSESLSADHGRMQISPCRLEKENGRLVAVPIRSKSGLIARLADADGYIMIDRDCEGLAKGAEVEVYPW